MGLEHDFPVRESAVPRIHVPPHRLDEWKEVAQDEITRAISQRHSWYNAFKDRVRDGYEMIADRPNLKAFVRNKPNSPDKDILIRSKLDGVTLDDLVSGMYCETTYDVRCTYAHLYEGNMLDAGLLQLHEGRTEEDPLHFVGMRWIAFRSPAPAIVTSRDFLFFSYEGTAYDVDGNRVLFRFLRTMPMDDVAVDDSNVPPLVRGKISNLHLYRQNGPHVDAFSKAMHSNAGNMPSWIVTKTISFMFPGIANMETVCDARALVNLGMAKLNPQRLKHPGSGRFSNSANVSTIAALQASTSACSVCFHKFKMTRAKRRCQSCCREVCKRCTRKLHLFDEAKQLSETAIVALRFCLNCTRQARAETRESLASYTHQRSSLHRSRRSSSGSLSMISTGQPSMHQLQQQQPQQHQLVVTRQQRSASDRELYHQAHPSVPSTPGQPQSYYYDDNDSDDGNSSYTSGGGGYTNGMLTPHGANYQHQHHSGMTPRTTALTPEQLQQLQQLQQTHQLNPQDHEEFLRLYGQYANAAARQKKLISIDQLARNRPYGPPPPPPAPPAPVPQYQVHPNAGTFRRHNSGGGKGWTHAAAVGIPQSPAVNGYQRGYVQSPETVPRHLLAPMPQPDLPTTSSSDMIPLTLHDHHNRQGYQPHHQSRSPPESAAASEDLEAIFRMRMMLFEDKPVETDTLSTASSTSSSAKRHMQRKALGNEHLVPQLVQRY